MNNSKYTEILKTYLKNYALITADYNKIFLYGRKYLYDQK